MTSNSRPDRPTMAGLYAQLARSLDRIPMRGAHYWIIVLVAFGALFDAIEQYNVGYAAPLLIDQWGISKIQVGLLTTFTFGGMAIGALIAGISGDLFGRKITYMYNLLLYTVGALVAALAPDLTVLLIGRLLVGFGLGGELNTGLTIVSELVPTKRRGASVAVVNIAAGGLGIFASAALATVILGPLAGPLGGDTVAWRWLLGLLVIPALLVFFYRRYIPESPRYLLSKGRVEAANRVLSLLAANRLRASGDLTVNRYVEGAEGAQAKREKVRLAEIVRGGLLRRTAVIWIVSWMTFGAQVTITVFMPTVLVSRGFPITSSLLYTTVINIGGLLGAVLASVFGHYWRRRYVLGYGSLVAVVVAIGFGVSNQVGLILALGGLLQLMFILLNTTTWVYTPELYPTRVRAFGTGAAVTVGLASASLTPLLAGVLFDAFDVVGMFVLVAIMYVIMAVTVAFGPETHGRSLEQLSEGVGSEHLRDSRQSQTIEAPQGLPDTE
ncbi:MAG: MFS transporter [Nocardioidaceae bacterium]